MAATTESLGKSELGYRNATEYDRQLASHGDEPRASVSGSRLVRRALALIKQSGPLSGDL